MATTSIAANKFVEALIACDLDGAARVLHPDISFRAMTPNKIWEAATPTEVKSVLEQWFADPDEDLERIEPTERASIEETMRVGWRVWISDKDGPCVFEQQAYIRESDGQINWMRVMCSGWCPRSDL